MVSGQPLLLFYGSAHNLLLSYLHHSRPINVISKRHRTHVAHATGQRLALDRRLIRPQVVKAVDTQNCANINNLRVDFVHLTTQKTCRITDAWTDNK